MGVCTPTFAFFPNIFDSPVRESFIRKRTSRYQMSVKNIDHAFTCPGDTRSQAGLCFSLNLNLKLAEQNRARLEITAP